MRPAFFTSVNVMALTVGLLLLSLGLAASYDSELMPTSREIIWLGALALGAISAWVWQTRPSEGSVHVAVSLVWVGGLAIALLHRFLGSSWQVTVFSLLTGGVAMALGATRLVKVARDGRRKQHRTLGVPNDPSHP